MNQLLSSISGMPRSGSRLAPATFSILLAIAANLGLFALLGWINRRAVAVADREIAATYRVELTRPPESKPLPPPPEAPSPRPPPRAEPLTVRQPPSQMRRPRPSPVPVRALRLELDLRTLDLPVVANVALPVAPPDAGSLDGQGTDREGAPQYYELSDVDEPPSRTRYVPPAFPDAARRRGYSGVVEVEFIVDADGTVQSPRVVSSTGRGLFDSAALHSVSRWRFRPARRGGLNVSVRCVVKIDFRLVE